MIINTFDYFITTDTIVPLVGTSSDIDTGNQNPLQWYIDIYEPEVLIKGLGRSLYQLFIAEFDADRDSPTYGDLLGGAPQRFTDLLDGLVYQVGGEDFYWNGLRFRIDPSTNPLSPLRSLIAYYVYYKYVNDNVENLTNLGVAIESVKNATIVDPTKLMVDTWRQFIHLYGEGFHNTGRHHGFNVNGFWVTDFTGLDNTHEVSLFRFLSDNITVYPEWRFTACANINQFGI